MTDHFPNKDVRARQTRRLLLETFARLASEQRYDSIATSELVAAAGVGRSTFYEHFADKDALLLAALEPVLIPLANAASGRGSKAAARMLLTHIWSKRSLFRSVLCSVVLKKIVQRLTDMILERIMREGVNSDTARVAAVASAHGQIAVVRLWVTGEISISIDRLAQQLSAFKHLFLDLPGSEKSQ